MSSLASNRSDTRVGLAQLADDTDEQTRLLLESPEPATLHPITPGDAEEPVGHPIPANALARQLVANRHSHRRESSGEPLRSRRLKGLLRTFLLLVLVCAMIIAVVLVAMGALSNYMQHRRLLLLVHRLEQHISQQEWQRVDRIDLPNQALYPLQPKLVAPTVTHDIATKTQ